MTEAFGFYAADILTKGYFTGGAGCPFCSAEATFETRCCRLEKRLSLKSWVLGVLVVVLLLPELKAVVAAALG